MQLRQLIILLQSVDAGMIMFVVVMRMLVFCIIVAVSISLTHP